MKHAYKQSEMISSIKSVLKYRVRQAVITDLDKIMEIEHHSFSSPWSKETLADEIAGKEWSRTIVAAHEGEAVLVCLHGAEC